MQIPHFGGFPCSQAHKLLTYDQPDHKENFSPIKKNTKKFDILTKISATAPLTDTQLSRSQWNASYSNKKTTVCLLKSSKTKFFFLLYKSQRSLTIDCDLKKIFMRIAYKYYMLRERGLSPHPTLSNHSTVDSKEHNICENEATHDIKIKLHLNMTLFLLGFILK